MTEKQFNEFVSAQDLSFFNEPILVIFSDGSSCPALWVLGIPGVDENFDGRTQGTTPESVLFYDCDSMVFVNWRYDIIKSMTALL